MKLRFYNERKWFNHKTNQSVCMFTVVLINGEEMNNIPWTAVHNVLKTYDYLYVNSLNELCFDIEAYSKAHPNDEADKDLGIHIAESRAKYKAYERGYRIISNIYDTIRNILNGDFLEESHSIDDYVMYLENLKDTERRHLINITE